MLDLLIGLFLAVMVMLYSFSLMLTSSAGAKQAEQTTIAYNAARQQLENVRAFRSAPLSLRTDAALIGQMPQIAQLNNGSGTLTIQAYRGTVRRVTVRILWRTSANRSRSIALTSLIAPGGVTP